MFKQLLNARLAQRQANGLLREVKSFDAVQARTLQFQGKSFINFSSNDYLGLAEDSGDYQTSAESGATSSPLVIGVSKIHQTLKANLLEWLSAPSDFDCLLFSSGFAANAGVLSALFNVKNGNAFLFQDRLNHASLLEAGSSAQAKGHCRQLRFKHNDLVDLDNLITTKSNQNSARLIATEGVFSMDGDTPDLARMKACADRHQALLLVDDAHGIGIRGEGGSGSMSAQCVNLDGNTISVITFGKALGAQGAAVIADKALIDYLANFSKEYIYSTHLSPVQSLAANQNIERIKLADDRRNALSQNVELFHSLMADSQYQLLESDSAIQGVVIGDETEASELANALNKKGIWVNAMRYPTVAKGKARLRITLNAKHQAEDISSLASVLKGFHD